MRIGRKYPILLAFAVLLATYASRPASAGQSQLRRSPQNAQATMDALRQPVPQGELQTFAADLTTLARALHDLNPNRPDVQSRMIELEQQIAAMTPEELTALANAYDRPALSGAVERLKSLMPSLNAAPGQAGQTLRPDLTIQKPGGALHADDASTTTTLSTASYSICTPASAPTFLIGPIPSDPIADYAVFVALQVAKAAQIPLDYACESIVEVLGEGTNVPFCVAAAAAKIIEFALEVSLDTLQFCDPFVLADENDAAYFNTIAIFNNLATDTSLIQNQLTSMDSDLNAHITAIDSDIDNHVTGINTNVDTNLTAIDTDIDTHVAAADLDIATRVANIDTDLNTHLTAVDTDLNTHLAAVDADVLTSSSAIATLQALDLRMDIERSLALGIYVGLFELPKANGGYLELVGTIVQTVINGLVAAGKNVGTAQTSENAGNTAYAAHVYKTAYTDYMTAYQTATK